MGWAWRTDDTTNMKIHSFQNGMTVADLKRLIADWPETDEDGEPCEVWLGNGGGLSNQAMEAVPLNMRSSEDGSKKWADLLLDHGAR